MKTQGTRRRWTDDAPQAARTTPARYGEHEDGHRRDHSLVPAKEWLWRVGRRHAPAVRRNTSRSTVTRVLPGGTT